MAARALANYDTFHKLPEGTATIDQVAGSSAGLTGWSRLTSKDGALQDALGDRTGRRRERRPTRAADFNGAALPEDRPGGQPSSAEENRSRIEQAMFGGRPAPAQVPSGP